MPMFSKPEIKDIVLISDCKDLLRRHSDKLDAAGAAKKLIMWSPLILSIGSPEEMAFSIATTDWNELAIGIVSVDKLLFSSLATDCTMHAINHEGEPQLRRFWSAMGDFYGSRIP
jgi:hypothetical protein